MTTDVPRSLSVVVPAYNEERRLPASLDRIVSYLSQKRVPDYEVLVVDDGSADATAVLVEAYGHKHPSVKLVRNPGNRGKGYAIRNGMLLATGEWILSTDADLSAPVEELEKLFTAASAQAAPVAIGSRALDRSLISVRQSPVREYSGRLFNVIVRLLGGLPFRDTQCGFKLFHCEAAKRIFALQQLDGFSFDVEDLYIARTLGIKVVEVPVRWANVEGTKVSAWSGARSFLDILKIRWFDWQGRYREPHLR